ncbi:hypothetical protein EJ07DRAFT_183973 [Lizonia empirigonia]|nr:hypothetical protein EJ07DRAFT_183973 [Lizonia empirigonia]
MPGHRKRTRNTNLIVIDSSSDSSEVSKDGAAESDVDSLLNAGSYASNNDMSERQTKKINSGSFGMFNRPTLTSRTSSTTDSGTKRRRVKGYDGHKDSSRSSKRSCQGQRGDPQIFMVDSEEDEESLFVPDTVPQSHSRHKPHTQDNQRVNAADGSLENMDWLGRGMMSRQKKTVNSATAANRDDDEDDDDEQDPHVPQLASRFEPVVIDDDSASEESLYDGMMPERAQKAKEYIQTLKHVDATEDRLRNAENELQAAATQHTSLLWNLATIDAQADNKVSDIRRGRDEMIRIANEHADAMIQRIRERLLAKKASFEKRMGTWTEHKRATEERVSEVRSEVETVREKRDELELRGGFELCSDVREIQAQKMNRKSSM